MKKFFSSGITAQDNSLGLNHLRKLFGELKQPSPGSTQNEQENKLYNMLPLFCKVYGIEELICYVYLQ